MNICIVLLSSPFCFSKMNAIKNTVLRYLHPNISVFARLTFQSHIARNLRHGRDKVKYGEYDQLKYSCRGNG